ncbi:MAG: divalent metal cation transporter [Dermatophilus congolensis]|nr:divalent metal cation transporter [Dermatophilus congolensis]
MAETPTSSPQPQSSGSTAISGSARRSAVLGAMFLMATSAIGPGFLTQTATFTAQLGAAFAFAIVLSIIVDIAVQLNVWRVIGISGMRAHELGNVVLKGAGWVLAALVVFGGMVFNIGNISGTGLGLNGMLGVDPVVGGVVSAALACIILLSKALGAALDKIVVGLGLLMIVLTTYVAFSSNPPVGDALRNSVMPETTNFLVITTLIGGTVGGYITYAGAHRLLDSGMTGVENASGVARSSTLGIIVTGVMRVVLFLAILGVVVGGAQLDMTNPAGSAFEHALGDVGRVVFGIVLWAASVTSVIGASYTSVSFMTKRSTSARTVSLITIVFIAIGAFGYATLGKAPATLLVFAGGFNGLILPLGFTLVLWVAWRRRDLLHGYRYPAWLLIAGVLAWLLTLFLGWQSISGLSTLWTGGL